MFSRVEDALHCDASMGNGAMRWEDAAILRGTGKSFGLNVLTATTRAVNVGRYFKHPPFGLLARRNGM